MPEVVSGKGKKDGLCNRSACLVQMDPERDNYFNSSTRAYYCRDCADKINYWCSDKPICAREEPPCPN